MRHVLTYLRLLPAAFCILLLVAWIGSFFIVPIVGFPVGKTTGRGSIYLENASLSARYRSPLLLWQSPGERGWSFTTVAADKEHQWTKLLGVLEWHVVDGSSFWDPTYVRVQIPIPFLLLLAVPLASAPLTRFRLPLWTWFAWTAFLAAALTFYLNTSRPPI